MNMEITRFINKYCEENNLNYDDMFGENKSEEHVFANHRYKIYYILWKRKKIKQIDISKHFGVSRQYISECIIKHKNTKK